jgi:hypothetical protein
MSGLILTNPLGAARAGAKQHQRKLGEFAWIPKKKCRSIITQEPKAMKIECERCETCIYWRRYEGNATLWGLCRIKAPDWVSITKHNPGGKAFWPITNSDDWCGEGRREATGDEENQMLASQLLKSQGRAV